LQSAAVNRGPRCGVGSRREQQLDGRECVDLGGLHEGLVQQLS
jgi:hypothetical protein